MWRRVAGWMRPSSWGPSSLDLLGQFDPPEHQEVFTQRHGVTFHTAAIQSACLQCATCCAVEWPPSLGPSQARRRVTSKAYAIRWKSRIWRHDGTTGWEGRVASWTCTRTPPHCPRWAAMGTACSTLTALVVDTLTYSRCFAGLRGPGARLGLALLHHHLREQRGASAPAGAPESARTVRVPYSCSAAWRGHRLQVGTSSITSGTWPVTAGTWSVTSGTWPVTAGTWSVTGYVASGWSHVISDFRYVASDCRQVISDFRYVASDCRHVISDFRYVANDCTHVISDFRYVANDCRHVIGY
jgi:hypothetical protein